MAELHFGNLSDLATHLGYCRRTLYNWRNAPKRMDLDLVEEDLWRRLELVERIRAIEKKPRKRKVGF